PTLVSEAQPFPFPSVAGRVAHGFYYPPRNPAYAAPAGDRPPLIVRCHGGPTASASATLDPAVQFWTSRGFALVDVDYAGSSGYGRGARPPPPRRRGEGGRGGVGRVGSRGRGGLRAGGALRRCSRVGRSRAARRPGFERRWLHRAVRAGVPRRVRCGSELLRHRRPRGAARRDPQVRVALRPEPDR